LRSVNPGERVDLDIYSKTAIEVERAMEADELEQSRHLRGR